MQNRDGKTNAPNQAPSLIERAITERREKKLRAAGKGKKVKYCERAVMKILKPPRFSKNHATHARVLCTYVVSETLVGRKEQLESSFSAHRALVRSEHQGRPEASAVEWTRNSSVAQPERVHDIPCGSGFVGF